MYGKGISREGSLLDVGVDLGIVKKSGAWFTYEGEQLGQGRENAKTFLSENLEIMVEISEKVRVAGRHRRGRRGRPGRRRRRSSTRPTSSRSTPRAAPVHRSGGARASRRGAAVGCGPSSAGRLDRRLVALSAVTRALSRAHLRVPDERARLRADRRAARGRRHGAGRRPRADADVVVLNTCCIRENADNKLYGNLGHLKALKDAAPEAARSWSAGAWPRRTATLDRAAGAVRRRGVRHAQRRTAPPSCSTRRAPTGPIVEILEEAVLDDRRCSPSALPARRETTSRGVGHDPDRLRQLVRVLHRAGGARRRRSAGRSATSSPRSTQLAGRRRHRGHAARPERQHLRPRPAAGQRAEAGRRRRPPARRCSPTCCAAVGAVDGIRRVRFTSPHPKDLRPETIAAMAEHAGGVRAPAPAAAVGQRHGAGGDAPRLHRRALPRAARRRPCRDRRPRRDHRHHRRLPRRDRRRLRAHARGRRRGRVRLRLHVHLLARGRHRGRRR